MRRVVATLALAGWLACSSTATARVELVSSQPLSGRLTELTLRTPALAQDTHVRILLPDRYASSPLRRYPVLYLLHGGADDYRSWVDKGKAEELTDGLPLIVVMPDAGEGGWYTDWHNNGAGGPPRWETWHVRELIPWIDRHYRTVPGRRGRALAGLSMGGFGALSYAARHPDMFVASAGFSAAVDTNRPPGSGSTFIELISGLDGGPPGSLWGPRATEEVRWRAHNPWDLAENLRGLNLTLRTGSGPFDPIEVAVHEMSVSLHNRLDELGIAHVWDDYGPGGHEWRFWIRDLELTLPSIMDSFARPPARPSRVTFTAVEPAFRVFGWDVRIERPALEFGRIEDAGRRGFTLAGSGEATVATPRLYRPRRRYAITLSGDFGSERRVRRAGRGGRLRLRVPLGEGNTFQAYSAPAAAAGTRVYRTRVRVARKRR